MKITSWNVNGIRAAVKKDFVNEFSKSDSDIYCLQETKAQNDQVTTALTEIEGYHLNVHSAVKKGYSGVAILSKEEPIRVATGIGIEEHDLDLGLDARRRFGHLDFELSVSRGGPGREGPGTGCRR